MTLLSPDFVKNFMTKIRDRVNPCPLTVGFHCWEDQSTPMLDFTCFYSVPWKKNPINNSKLWSDEFVSSILLAGTKNGTIVAYKILSNQNEIIDTFPLCLIFGHQTQIKCITSCSPFIYTKCVASLSKDGTLSLISIEDLTIILNRPNLFSENSNYLAKHGSRSDLMLASQAYGTIEVANIIDGAILMTISGFPSLISSITCHGTMHAISTFDGSVNIINVSDDVGYTFSYTHNENELYVVQAPSPDLTFILTLTDNHWTLQEINKEPYVSGPPPKGDSYSYCEWISNTMFYVKTFSGFVQIFEVPASKENSYVFDGLECKKQYLFVQKGASKATRIEPLLIREKLEQQNLPKLAPKELLSKMFALKHYEEPISATCEGFIVFSPGKSIIQIFSPTSSYACDLSKYFSGRYRARCGIMRPASHEARIDSEGNVFLDDFTQRIGVHKGAFMLYSPPLPTKTFLSFSTDGSIYVWGKTLNMINAMTEPVKSVQYVIQRKWIICIGTFSFIVIDCADYVTVCMCDGHESPILEVTYVDGTFHARTECSDLYVWSCESELIGKGRLLLGHDSGKTYLPNSISVQRSAGSMLFVNEEKFSDIININMPNCQTFVVVTDIMDFVSVFDRFDELDVANDPKFLPIRMLWSQHLGKEVFGKVPILGDFGFCPGGDNYTVTLPVCFNSHKAGRIKAEKKTKSSAVLASGKVQRTPTLNEIPKSQAKSSTDKFELHKAIDFMASPLLSAIHAVAASATGQCFISSKNEELSVLCAQCQIQTTIMIKDGVQPSIDALATWFLSKSHDVRFIVYNFLFDYFNILSDEQRLKTVEYIFYRFNNWIIRLPFIFIMCHYVKDIPRSTIKEAAEHIFPICAQRVDYLRNLGHSFKFFLEFVSIKEFFAKLINKLGETPEIVPFAVHCPMDFIAFVKERSAVKLVTFFIERWMSPDPKIILQLVSQFALGESNGAYQKLFERIANILPFVSFTKEFCAVGDNNGLVTVVERGTANVLWTQKLFNGLPVSFISCAPTGQRFICVCATVSQIAWVNCQKVKNQIAFEVSGIQEFPSNQGSQITNCSWTKDTNIVLKTSNGAKIFEGSAPGLSFFKRVFH